MEIVIKILLDEGQAKKVGKAYICDLVRDAVEGRDDHSM